VLGALLGNYRVVEQLSEGSMGIVYVGRHDTLGRPVVVKVLQPELSRNGDMVQRFFNEAQAATAIRNPGIVHIFDFGTTPEGRAYIVMEQLEGESLVSRLRQRRLDYIECCRIGRQVANVVQAAHAAGITHRNLKPGNLFLVRDPEVVGGERVKVLDFGLAKLASEAQASGVKTRTGLMMGSPLYMSPEQCRSLRTADARSDVYALGCILFEMVCGRPPFIGHGMGDIVGAHMYKPAPAPQSFAPDIPPPLAELISQMLAKEPDARPQTMAVVSQALDEVLHALGGGPPSRPSMPALGRAPTAQPAPGPLAQPAPQPGLVSAATAHTPLAAGPAAGFAAGFAPAVTVPPDATTGASTLPRSAPSAPSPASSPGRPQAPPSGRPQAPSPARQQAPQPGRASTPPGRPSTPPPEPMLPEPTLNEPTLYEPTMHDATASTEPASTMVLSDPTIMPVSEPTMSDPTMMPLSDDDLPSPQSPRAPAPVPVPSSASAPAARAPTPWPTPGSAAPPPAAQAPWSTPGSPPSPSAGQAPWPASGSAPPPAVAHPPWQAPSSTPPPAAAQMPFSAPSPPPQFPYAATPSPVSQGSPPMPALGAYPSRPGPQSNIAALQRAFVRGVLLVIGAVVTLAIVLGTCNST
jgi:serine/threonine protein kinase